MGSLQNQHFSSSALLTILHFSQTTIFSPHVSQYLLPGNTECLCSGVPHDVKLDNAQIRTMIESSLLDDLNFIASFLFPQKICKNFYCIRVSEQETFHLEIISDDSDIENAITRQKSDKEKDRRICGSPKFGYAI